MKALCFGVFVCLGLASTSAYAAGSPVAVNGSYQLTCKTAELVLHLDIGATTATQSGNFSGSIVVPFDCDGVSPEEISAFEAEVTDSCVAANIPAKYCASLAQDLGVAASEFNDDALQLIPQTLTLTVQSVYNFWNQLFGVYPLFGQHKFSDGSISNLTYAFNNNQNSFGIAGVQLLNSASSGQLGCADLAVGGVNGIIDRTRGELSAQYAIDRSLYCMAIDEVGIIGGSIGLAFRGSVNGKK